MAKLTEEIILKALSTVQDPSQGSDIVALNLVTAIKIKDTNISFALQVPPHRGPAMEPVRRAAEQVALQIEGVTSATVMVTAHATNETIQAPEEPPTLSREKILESKVRRFVAVGKSPAHALGVVAQKLGKTGRLKLSITGREKKPVATASADFLLKDSIVRGYPDEDGILDLHLPVGAWKVSVADIGREGEELSLEIKDGQSLEKSISMDEQSGIRFSVKKEDGSRGRKPDG